jgi:hypothetical protein
MKKLNLQIVLTAMLLIMSVVQQLLKILAQLLRY